MNQLNSVILEGNTVGGVRLEKGKTEKDYRGYFVIENTRYAKVDDERVKSRTLWSIEVSGRLAESSAQYLQDGKGVRVVGRLARTPEGNAILIGEHVEFRARPAV